MVALAVGKAVGLVRALLKTLLGKEHQQGSTSTRTRTSSHRNCRYRSHRRTRGHFPPPFLLSVAELEWVRVAAVAEVEDEWAVAILLPRSSSRTAWSAA